MDEANWVQSYKDGWANSVGVPSHAHTGNCSSVCAWYVASPNIWRALSQADDITFKVRQWQRTAHPSQLHFQIFSKIHEKIMSRTNRDKSKSDQVKSEASSLLKKKNELHFTRGKSCNNNNNNNNSCDFNKTLNIYFFYLWSSFVKQWLHLRSNFLILWSIYFCMFMAGTSR